MNRLDTKRRVQIINALVEGVGIRSTTRLVGCTKGAVAKLIADLGPVCMEYQDRALRNLRPERVQADEIWSFVGMKQRNVPPEKRGEVGFGSVWTWVGLGSGTKLLVSWHVGLRTLDDARAFVGDLAGRFDGRIQLTTDGRSSYLSAIIEKFPANGIDYAVLLKFYGPSANDGRAESRYSPSSLVALEKRQVLGHVDPEAISTSHAERLNLSIRMGLRRWTRLTNGHSKKLANHVAAFSIFSMVYNFCRIHQTLRVTPAMAAGVSDRVWDLEEVLNLLGS